MQRSSFDFDVITGPAPTRPVPNPKPQPETAKNDSRQDKEPGK